MTSSSVAHHVTRTAASMARRTAVLAALFAAACGGGGSDVSGPPSGGGAAADVSVSPSTATIAVGQSTTLQATVHDASGATVSGASVFWSSSDTTIANVSSGGVVTGRAPGTAQIAASSGGRSSVAAVTVTQVPVSSVAVLPSSATLVVGGDATLRAATYDGSGNTLSGRTVVWSSSAPGTVTVDQQGNIHAVAAGSATITATSEGKSGSATVSVSVIPVASVTVSPGASTLIVGQTVALTATTRDANGNTLAGRPVTWTSSNNAVATVSTGGLVTAKGAGTATITATSEGKTGTAQISVSAPPPSSVASVSVDPSSKALSVGGQVQLTATLKDASGNTLTGRTVTWTTNAPTIATVSSDGMVTAVAPGTATITATSEGQSGTSTITVTATAPPPSPTVARVTITPSTNLFVSNKSPLMLTAHAYDANGNEITGLTATWTSSDPSSASVTPTGTNTATVARVRTTGKGTVTITATIDGQSASVIVGLT